MKAASGEELQGRTQDQRAFVCGDRIGQHARGGLNERSFSIKKRGHL